MAAFDSRIPFGDEERDDSTASKNIVEPLAAFEQAVEEWSPFLFTLGFVANNAVTPHRIATDNTTTIEARTPFIILSSRLLP
jgi:hypothetical protein